MNTFSQFGKKISPEKLPVNLRIIESVYETLRPMLFNFQRFLSFESPNSSPNRTFSNLE